MFRREIGLVIRQVEPVPDTFHARHSTVSRHYLYRIGVTQSRINPITEWRKCWFVKEPFCFEKASEACQLFLGGPKNLAAFCHKISSYPPDFPTEKTLNIVEIRPGRPLFDPSYDRLYEGIRFYDFHVQGKSFMYRQVRRMVSVIVHCAQNRVTLEEAQKLFEPPYEWNTKVNSAPPFGLYLLDAKLNTDGEPQGPTQVKDSETSDDDPCDSPQR